jgi:poly(glycerol-phosphate) alpha-glucosyltransferase
MPEGQYFSISGRIPPGTGGQTRAVLMRNRLFAQRAGIEPTLLTFDITPTYPHTREVLRGQGQLVDPMRLLNIFEWYRESNLEDLPPTGEALPEISGFDAVDEAHPDGSVYVTKYVHTRGRSDVIHDYRRPDGSVFVRCPANFGLGTTRPVTDTFVVNSSGQPVGRWPTVAGWRQNWVMSLAKPDRPVFIISDSREMVVDLLPMPDERFHVMHLMHNIHLQAPRRWNSPIQPTYVQLFQSMEQLDGLVTLTRTQLDDVAARFGPTSNLYVVPNPVDIPSPPDPLPSRERQRFAVVSRFEGQKRLEDAVRAFTLVLKEEPGATLDIYGDGSLRVALEQEIADQRVADSVFLRGHDPRAREALWTATGFLMTSRFEGYPLATLESLSHGCPVISYDIKYGPSQQITHGVDGYLIPAGDTQAMADRIVELIRNPDVVTRMSEAALDKAAQHDHQAFLNDWQAVLDGVIAAKQRRTTLDSVTLKTTRLGYLRAIRLPAAVARFPVLRRLARPQASSRAWRAPRKLEFMARLEVDGHSPESSLDSAVVTLDAVGDGGGAVVAIPMRVGRSDTTFQLIATVDLDEVFRAMDEACRSVRLRLRLVWENSSWEKTLSRPRRMEPNYEVSFSGTGEICLNRGKGAPRHQPEGKQSKSARR